MSLLLFFFCAFLIAYMYLVRHFNAKNFCKALDVFGSQAGGVFAGVRYHGEYGSRAFTYNKYGKATYMYIATKHPDAKNELSGMVIPYGWKKIAPNIIYSKGKLFYSSFDRVGMNFFVYLYTAEQFKEIFEKLIATAKQVEGQPR